MGIILSILTSRIFMGPSVSKPPDLQEEESATLEGSHAPDIQEEDFNNSHGCHAPDLQEKESATHDGPQAEYFSVRIQNMIDESDKFTSEDDFRMSSSKMHWTPLLEPECVGMQKLSEVETLSALEEKWGPKLLSRTLQESITLGRKIGEGGQAKIFEARFEHLRLAVKVFKPNKLDHLQRQWPDKLFELDFHKYLSTILGGFMLDKNRYAFVMQRFSGDLRSNIDTIMMRNNAWGPPFEEMHALWLMWAIALGMEYLHSKGVLHRDLKASNILVLAGDDPCQAILPFLADYELSLGVVGTGLWRAPEVLQALGQNGCTPEMTTKTDVYSFGMICYEILTGRIPFEDHRHSDHDLVVVKGERPKLPTNIDPRISNLVSRCWHKDPAERPTFLEIGKELNEISRLSAQFAVLLRKKIIPFQRGKDVLWMAADTFSRS